jgi:hypothetical protein
MHCEKCKKKISEDSIFCEFCGHKISREIHVSKKKKKEDIIKEITLKHIANHLEFLGYEIEKLDSEGEREFIAARHAKENNLLYWQVYPNFILFKTGLKTSKASSSPK